MNTPKYIVTAFNKPRINRANKKTALVLAITVVIVASFYVYQTKFLPKKTLACTNSPHILNEAANLLLPEKTTELKAVVEKIRSLKDYGKDPNCLNIVVTYYINITDPVNAREALNKLDNVYDPAQGFAPPLQMAGGKDIEQIHTNIEFIEKLDQEFKKNMFYGPEL